MVYYINAIIYIIYKCERSVSVSKKLIFALIAFFILLSIFIGIVLRSEYKNMEEVKKEYPDLSEEVYSYRKTNLKIWVIGTFLKFLIPLLFLTTKLSARIRNFARGKTGNFFLTVAVYVFIFTIIDLLISLPLSYYSGFVVSHRFGLSNQTISRWVELIFKNLALNLIISIAVTWFPFYIMFKSPKRWWLYLGLLSFPVILFITFISPMYIDPLFHEYTSIEDKELERDIRELLTKAGVGDAEVYQVNMSQDTKLMNAYMTGVFKSKRIVLWDTTIDNLDNGEVLSITAHEIGHYVKGHIWKGIILGGFLTILLLFLINKTTLWILKNSEGQFGLTKIHDIAALPLLILVLNFYMFLSSPIINGYSRHIEWEADKFELELARDREAAASSMLKLHEESLSLPRPSNIYKIWYHSHPTCEERVNFALTYEYENKLP